MVEVGGSNPPGPTKHKRARLYPINGGWHSLMPNKYSIPAIGGDFLFDGSKLHQIGDRALTNAPQGVFGPLQRSGKAHRV